MRSAALVVLLGIVPVALLAAQAGKPAAPARKAAAPARPNPDAPYKRLEAQYVREFLRRHPVVSTYLGGSGLYPELGRVDGMLREDELYERTGFRLPPGPYETLAGFLMARLGHIPAVGETVTENGWEFTVVEVDRRRIEQVRVTRP